MIKIPIFFAKKTKGATMYAKGFLHKLLSSVMHKKRLTTLILLINGLLIGKKISLTELGRHIDLPIQERSGIRRSDRFIGNKKLQIELNGIYKNHITALIKGKRPKIIVDWSHIPNTTHYNLTAALAAEGRSLILYQEVHSEKKQNNAKVESAFLEKLASFISSDIKPIIITDAGFRNPWFKKVLKLNWDFVGRIRGTQKYYDGKNWYSCRELLLQKGCKRLRSIGKVLLCKKRNPVTTYLYLAKEKYEGSRWKYTKKHGGIKTFVKAAKEPWLLASSLENINFSVIKLYKMRMQIEENFRDLKNNQYGFSLKTAHSRCPKRIRVLLVIAMLASLIAWLVGSIAEQKKWQYQFQVNSIKRRVLSLFFLGCQVIKRQKYVSNLMLMDALENIEVFSL